MLLQIQILLQAYPVAAVSAPSMASSSSGASLPTTSTPVHSFMSFTLPRPVSMLPGPPAPMLHPSVGRPQVPLSSAPPQTPRPAEMLGFTRDMSASAPEARPARPISGNFTLPSPCTNPRSFGISKAQYSVCSTVDSSGRCAWIQLRQGHC